MKQKSKGVNTAESLAKRVADSKGNYDKDPRFFVAKTDKEGNGTVIMRFLPHAAIDGEDYADYVTLYKHGFQDAGTQQWYIENSRTTLPDPNSKYGMPDPVSEANRALFAELGKDAAIKYLREAKRNRQTKYIANILILKNDEAPDTVGGVYLFEFGQKILDKIVAKTKKDLEDDIVFDAFNMFEGANFRMKMKKVDGNRNYDDSFFDQPAALYGGDEDRLKAIYEKLYSISAEIAEDKFKSYDELQKRFIAVTTGKTASKAENDAPTPKDDSPAPAPKAQAAAATPAPKQEKKSDFFDDMDDDIPF